MKLSKRTPTIAPPPGLYEHIAPSDYFRWAAWSASTLKHIGEWDQGSQSIIPGPEKSPAHLRHYLDNAEESTPAQDFGSAMHCLWLEPERFRREYHVLHSPINRRTNDGKAEWAALIAQYGEDRIITAEEWETLQAMAAAAAAHPWAKPLLSAVGQREVSAVWTDDATGLLCKGRFDKLVKLENEADGFGYIIADPKSARCAHWRMFEKDSASYGYHISMAMYRAAIRVLTGKDARCYLIVQEKTAPYAVVVYDMPPEVLDAGEVVYRAMLAEAARCEKLNKWPGYADDRAIPLGLPTWAHAEAHDPTEAPTQNRRELTATTG